VHLQWHRRRVRLLTKESGNGLSTITRVTMLQWLLVPAAIFAALAQQTLP